MNRLFPSLLAFAFLLGSAGAVNAAPCRDSHGHFMKCHSKHMKRCRDSHGRFMKCGRM